MQLQRMDWGEYLKEFIMKFKQLIQRRWGSMWSRTEQNEQIIRKKEKTNLFRYLLLWILNNQMTICFSFSLFLVCSSFFFFFFFFCLGTNVSKRKRRKREIKATFLLCIINGFNLERKKKEKRRAYNLWLWCYSV